MRVISKGWEGYGFFFWDFVLYSTVQIFTRFAFGCSLCWCCVCIELMDTKHKQCTFFLYSACSIEVWVEIKNAMVRCWHVTNTGFSLTDTKMSLSILYIQIHGKCAVICHFISVLKALLYICNSSSHNLRQHDMSVRQSQLWVQWMSSVLYHKQDC